MTKEKNTTQPPYIIGNGFLNVTVNGVPYTMYKDDFRYENVLSCLREKRFDELENLISVKKMAEKLSFGKITIQDGALFYKGKQTHHSMIEKVMEFSKEGFDVTYLLKFMNKLFKNPDERSLVQLYDYLNLYKLPITESGNFLAMKAVTSDYKDKHTKKIDNSVGKVVKQKRKHCDNDPDQACSSGLHCGNYDYVIGFYGSGNDRIVLVEVNPRDVISCPKDCSYQKLRVCKYRVIKDLGAVDEVKEFNKSFMSMAEEAPQFVAKAPVRDSKGRFLSQNKSKGLTSNGTKSKGVGPVRDSKGRFIKSN